MTKSYIGNNYPVELNYFIDLLEDNLGKKANRVLKPMQDGDVVETYADTDLLNDWVGFKAKISIEDGIKRFTNWFLDYYGY